MFGGWEPPLAPDRPEGVQEALSHYTGHALPLRSKVAESPIEYGTYTKNRRAIQFRSPPV